MALFGKKREENKGICACSEASDGAERIYCVKVLGGGCKNCRTLYENAKEAISNAGFDVQAEYVTDMQKVMEYGIMSTPALVVNDQVVSMGRVLNAADVEKLLRQTTEKKDC